MPKGGPTNALALETYGRLLTPEAAVEPILAKPVRTALLEWLTEIWAEDDLAAVGLEPRRRALFFGPPGVGKTTLAHHLAARLGLMLLVVEPERIIDCWLGSTGRAIGGLFAALEAHRDDDGDPIMVFFDEFDSLAIKRRTADTGAAEERNSWVNVLLQRIENFDGYMVAATNRQDDVDPAAWRRFDLQILLDLPGPFERQRILARYFAPLVLPDASLAVMSEAFSGATPALIRGFCESLKRQIVLGPKLGWPMVKDAVIARILNAVEPHPDCVRPPLWSQGRERKQAILALPWPLELPQSQDEAAA